MFGTIIGGLLIFSPIVLHFIHIGGMIVVLIVVISVGFGITRVSFAREREELRAKYVEELRVRNIKEAESTTMQVVHLCETGEHSVVSLPSVIKQAGEELKIAKAEYSDHAFSPFWDAVERATQQIAAYRKIVSTINNQADQYYKALHGREHNFGPFPVRSEDLPTLAPVLDEYRRVVRLGQTDFQFASIYEQRKTREVLIEGFRTLGEAIENVGWAVTQSLAELETTMQSGLSEIRDQIDTVGKSAEAAVEELRSHTAKLDNIQWQRKPQLPGE